MTAYYEAVEPDFADFSVIRSETGPVSLGVYGDGSVILNAPAHCELTNGQRKALRKALKKAR